MGMRKEWALLTAFLVVSCPQGAVAQEPPGAGGDDAIAEALSAKGVALRKAGQDAEALALFERAFELRPSPRGVAQIALAHQALAHWREAEQGLLDALHDSNDLWIARNRAYLEESLATVQAHLAWLDIESNVAGAEVWIGGEPSGRLPLDTPMRIVAGEVPLEVRVPGYTPVARMLRVDGGTHFHTEFLFAAQALTPPPSRAMAEVPPARSERRQTVGWGVLAAAGGLALVGVAGAITREWEAHIYKDDGKCGPLPGQPRSVRCGAQRDTGDAAQTIAVAAFVGSGIAVAVSGVVLFGGSRSKPTAAMNRVGCVMAGAGLMCGGTF